MSKSNSREKIGKSIDGILGNLTIRGREENKEEFKEIEELKKRLASYEQLGSLVDLEKEKELLFHQKQQFHREIQQFAEQKKMLSEELLKLEGIVEENQKEVDHLLNEIRRLRIEKESAIQELEQVKKDIEVWQVNRRRMKVKNSDQGKQELMTLMDASLYDKDKKAYQPSAIIRQYCERPEGKRKLTIHLREIEYQAILKAAHHFHSSKGQLMDMITKALRFYISKDYYIEAEREVFLKAIHSVRNVLENMGYSTEDIEQRLRMHQL